MLMHNLASTNVLNKRKKRIPDPAYLKWKQFEYINKYLPKVKRTKKSSYTRFEKFLGVMYILRTGCQWNELPEKYPPYKNVHKFFRWLCNSFRLEKVLKNINQNLSKKGDLDISYPDFMLIIDTKSIRTTEYFDQKTKGRDGNKKIKGIKLALVVDRARRCWGAGIFPANKDERKCFKITLSRTMNSQIAPRAICVIGDRFFDSEEFREFCSRELKLTLYTLKKNPYRKVQTIEDEIKRKFIEKKMKAIINPFRYIVEQTFANLEKARRLIVVYERKYTSFLGFVNLRLIELTLRQVKELKS